MCSHNLTCTYHLFLCTCTLLINPLTMTTTKMTMLISKVCRYGKVVGRGWDGFLVGVGGKVLSARKGR